MAKFYGEIGYGATVREKLLEFGKMSSLSIHIVVM
jgi:hypothetical protein